MNKAFAITASAALFGGLAYLNYRRFVPKPQTFCETEYAVKTTNLTVEMTNCTIAGELLTPQSMPGKLPTVICSHGFGSSGKFCKSMVGMSLAMSGYQVVVFDFYGGSPRSKSGGKMTEMSVFTEKDNLNAVIDKVRTLPNVDIGKVFLLGESQGGFVTAITAAERPQDIRGVIEYYPAFVIPDDARRRFHSEGEIPDEYHHMGRKLGKIYCEKLLNYDVFSVIPNYTGPVLIVHGDNDKVVDISYGRRAAEVYQNAEFVPLHGEGHGFMGDGRKTAAGLSYEFLQRLIEPGWRKEILTIDVTLTESRITQNGIYNVTTVPFTGTAESKWFRGKILPGASDVQRRKLWITDRFCADYTLEGTDCADESCRIHIVNVDDGKGWKPTVTTDSKALSFLNNADCKAIIQGHKDKLTVRIFARAMT